MKKNIKITDVLREMKEDSTSYLNTGIIAHKQCYCGKYKPRSTKGIIDYKCKNCGGEKVINLK